ncbi:protein arv1 homolog isoform X2 [Amborella trichopoda]|uniref:protein arv1 homolog isoform X2 n=1 Tax=Amborella trichopoda TaxID=13333 RepID=UPI0009BF9071|nr:protein arv1 homolog isoform X2 [Amborella trichopoda]XP_020531733.1 protein arv1 homolog isoform X2 [Amborella trichopoda]|eukprot:XP_020531732.1 protein arv1 homolog isoform X2 [Amborella trichopoda]
MGFRCVHCGFEVRALFIQYSPGNIRLTKCGRCGAVADEYVECEYMILLIDLILHKAKAYRHLLYNFPNRNVVNLEGILWKSAFFFLVIDTCRELAVNKIQEGLGSSASSSASPCTCGKLLMNVFLGNFIFLGALLLGTKILQKSSSEILRFKEVLLAIIVSSYFKIFLITMMIWEFPLSVLFIIDLFVLSSNAVALKACVWCPHRQACFRSLSFRYMVKVFLVRIVVGGEK